LSVNPLSFEGDGGKPGTEMQNKGLLRHDESNITWVLRRESGRGRV
jgi:hypothetical protein